ncbi:Annexin [Zostera marina]|uniref:Annexin n=1 Tax=Zostera marina TaxID=29655 RepID=A0A0K9P7B9_ZOSMR|nr:Annexin [Zostera marina]
MATLSVPHHPPSPAEDAEQLRKACQGWGTDEKALIEILTHRNSEQRNQIRLAYEERYKESIIKRLESELSGEFEKAVYRWVFDPLEREAIIVNVAVKQKIDYRVIVETACVNTPDELLAVKKAYQARFKHSMEEDIATHSTGDLRKFLVGLVGTYRFNADDAVDININLAFSEAKILHDAIVDKAFHHDEIFRILTTRSKAQLNATFNKYKDEFGTSIIKNLSSKTPDEVVTAIHIAIRCFKSPQNYFAKMLRISTAKAEKDENTLTRVIVTRAEKDLKLIKNVYFKRTDVPLEQAVGKATSGDYKAFLLALIGN